MKKTGPERLQTVETALFPRWTDTRRFPFRGETKCGKVRSKRPEGLEFAGKAESRKAECMAAVEARKTVF